MSNILEWSHINLSIETKDKKNNRIVKSLLSDLQGSVSSGELLAILGPTGCGKSSLCNVLSGKINYSRKIHLLGNIYYNKQFMNHGISGRMIGYVGQNETAFAFLTVRETLHLAAYFHSAASMTYEERDHVVQAVIRELSLLKVADSILGNERTRGISGGEYKRVLIGKELIKNPDIILLDEPTSGLDSFQALSVMDTMKKLAQQGKIVISVIHQPRSSIFALFDKIMLLSEGKVIYNGPTANSLHYFGHLGYACPVHYNPADYFLDILSIDVKSIEMERESRERIRYFVKYWKDHGKDYFGHSSAWVNMTEEEMKATEDQWDIQWQQNRQRQIEEAEEVPELTSTSHIIPSDTLSSNEIVNNSTSKQPSQPTPTTTNIIAKPSSAVAAIAGGGGSSTSSRKISSAMIDPIPMAKPCSSWFHDFLQLFWRSIINIFRNCGGLMVRCVTTLFFAILVSLIYRNLDSKQKGIQNRTGLLYFVLINQGFSPLIGVLTTLPTEKLIVNREVNAGSYRFSSYYIASIISELPSIIILCIVYSTIIYWSTGLNPQVDRFFIFLGILFLTTTNATALGYFVSSISPNAAIANAIGPPVFIILLLYGGFYINASSLPVGSVWVRNLSLVYWGFQALIVNEFRGETFTCSDATSGCRRTGEEQIQFLSFQNASVSESAGMLAVLIVGFFLLGYIGLLIGQQRFHRIHPVNEEEEQENKEEADKKKSTSAFMQNSDFYDMEEGKQQKHSSLSHVEPANRVYDSDDDDSDDDMEEEEVIAHRENVNQRPGRSSSNISTRFFVA